MRVRREGVARHRLPLRVQLEQFLGHVAHRLLDARLRLLPGRAAQPIERRSRASGVLLNEIEALDGDEQFVVSVISQLEKLLNVRSRRSRRTGAGGQLLQPDEFPDSVIDMDHEISDLQIAKVGEECSRKISTLLGSSTLFLEYVSLRIELEARVLEPETLRQIPSRNQDGRGVCVLGRSTGTAMMS